MSATVLVVENEASGPIGPLGDWLRAAGLTLDVRRAHAGDEVPAQPTGFDGLLVLGGAMGCEDDDTAPWLVQVRALMRAALGAETPQLGICLGAQLLARANGATVAPNPNGPEYGAQLVAKRAVAANDPLFGPLPITPDVIQWHVDTVTALPPGAQLLASSPMCEVEAFRLGRLAWGIQFHIETTPQTVRQWAAEDAASLDGYDVDALLARSDAVHADIEETWRPFAEAFAAVVRDPAAVAAVPTPLPVIGLRPQQ